MEQKLAAGRYLMIVREARGVRLKASDLLVVGLHLLVAMGPSRGMPCSGRVFFKTDEEALAKTRFNRLGGTLRELSTVEEDAATLVGNLLRVDISYDQAGQQNVRIHGYVGRDDPGKYTTA